jgi:hypothetical protein
MDPEQPMKFEAHQHLQMSRLIRRKAARLGNPRHMMQKANLFLALAKASAKQGQHCRPAPPMSARQSPRTGNINPAMFHPAPRASRPALPSLLQLPDTGRHNRLDPRRLFGPLA